MARKIIDELDEPQTIWSAVSRFAGLGCLLLMICIISVPFFPRFRDYRILNEEGRHVAEERDRVRAQLDSLEAELNRMQKDDQYFELKARDHLDLSKPDEVIYRFEKDE